MPPVTAVSNAVLNCVRPFTIVAPLPSLSILMLKLGVPNIIVNRCPFVGLDGKVIVKLALTVANGFNNNNEVVFATITVLLFAGTAACIAWLQSKLVTTTFARRSISELLMLTT